MVHHSFVGSLRDDMIKDLKFYSDVLKLDMNQTKQLISFLNNQAGYSLSELQTLVYKMIGEFLDVYQALIPVLSMQYYTKDDIDYEIEGSTTSNFDSVKQFYLDIYEAMGNLLIIPVALNNIKYRSSFDSLIPINNRNNTLAGFIGLTKANCYKYCVDTEMYTQKLGIIVNSKLRNAIGHNDVEYNTVSQKITVVPLSA